MSDATKGFFTPERIAQLEATPIDFSDILEITDFSGFWLRQDRLNGKIKPRLVQGEDGKLGISVRLTCAGGGVECVCVFGAPSARRWAQGHCCGKRRGVRKAQGGQSLAGGGAARG